MALYPGLSSVPYVDISGASEQKVLITNFEGLGKESRKRKWLYPKRSIDLSYENITDTELKTLLQFEKNRSGTYESFHWIAEYDEDYDSEYVGTGDGDTVLWNLPCKEASDIVVYVDDREYEEGSDSTAADLNDYVITSSGGTDGVDKIVFTDAPSAGVRIIIDFTGRLALQCRFANNIQYQRLRYGTVGFNSCSISLKGLLIDE